MTHLVPYGTQPKADRRRRLEQQRMRLRALMWPDRRRRELARMGAVVASHDTESREAATRQLTAARANRWAGGSDWAAQYFAALALEFNARRR